MSFALYTSKLAFCLEVRKNACDYRIQVIIMRVKATGVVQQET